MFKAKEYLEEILNYSVPLSLVVEKTKLEKREIGILLSKSNYTLTNKQELAIIRLWATCVHAKNIQEGSI